MIVFLCILGLAALYCYLFNFIGLSLWFNFLWVFVSIILAFLTFVLFVAILFVFWKKTDPKKKFRHMLLHQVCHMILFCINVKVKVIGKENIPNVPFVCYANHKSDIDPVALYYGLHRVCSAVGKKDLFKYPVIKQCKPVFGVIAIDRENDRAAAKEIIKGIRAIQDGMSYIVFPEGGIKSRDTEEMVNLRAGAYKLVTKSEALLLPAAILGSSKTKKRKTLFSRVKITLIFHKPMTPMEYGNMNTTEIGEHVMEMINKDVLEYENKSSN